MSQNPKSTGESTKLQTPFGKSPLVVVGVLPKDTYQVKKLNESNDRNYVTTANIKQLKIWKNTSLNEYDYDLDECDLVDSDINVNARNDCELYTENETNDEQAQKEIEKSIENVSEQKEINDNYKRLKCCK